MTWLTLAARRPPLDLGDGRQLRLLPLQDLWDARRQALLLAEEGRDLALCSNACLVAKALVTEAGPVYAGGTDVLDRCTPEEIQTLAGRWAAFQQAEDPGLTACQDTIDRLRESLRSSPSQRLRWRVLKAFGALPTEERARRMTGRDYLWCGVNLLLDEEEKLDALCPLCRARAGEDRCPVCGREKGAVVTEENGSFDWARFARMKGEGL